MKSKSLSVFLLVLNDVHLHVVVLHQETAYNLMPQQKHHNKDKCHSPNAVKCWFPSWFRVGCKNVFDGQLSGAGGNECGGSFPNGGLENVKDGTASVHGGLEDLFKHGEGG